MATDFPIIETAATAVSAMPTLGLLSFTTCRADGSTNLWSPADVVGDWDAQCRAGRKLGDEACHHIFATGNVPLIPSIVRAIVERGSFGGVETGFFSAITERLID